MKSFFKSKASASTVPRVATTASRTLAVESKFENFLDLPPEIQSSILSKGLPTTALRPSQQLELAAKTTPRTVLSPDFLLPKHIIAIFNEGYNAKVEEKNFKSATEIKDYIADIFKNISINDLYMIRLQNDYTYMNIINNQSSKEGTITINISIPKTDHTIAALTFNFTRVKNQYDTIILSKVSLKLNLKTDSDIEYLKEIFIGLRWLPLIFKKITWNRDLLSFENSGNISIYSNDKKIVIQEANQEIVQKALLLLRYVEINLKPKRKTTRSTKR